MKKALWVLVGAFISILSLSAQQPPAPAAGREPSWAFQVINGAVPAEEPGPKSLPGSTKTYTPAQIDDLLNPPDWYPDEHPPAPPIVQKGRGAVLACGACHLMNGEGHPESAGLTGFTAGYIAQQMADFKSGVRKDAARMNAIAKDMTDDEIRQASEWFAKLKPMAWTRVTEAATVPKTFVGQGRMRFVQPGGEMEPIGNRIITVPMDQTRARHRDPHAGAGFIALRARRQRRQRQSAGRDRWRGEDDRLFNLPRRHAERAGRRAQTGGSLSDLRRATTLSLQGRHEKRRRRAAHEEAGRETDRRRHTRDFGVPRVARAVEAGAGG